jgi:hypothetical protein
MQQQTDHVFGDFVWRAERNNGVITYYRKINNTEGAVFEEVHSLEEVPTPVITKFSEYVRVTA